MTIDTAFTLDRGNKKLVFCAGCFDLLHEGHLELFKSAKKHGDLLMVGVASDLLIKIKKGRSRPIENQKVRIEKVNEALNGIVDYVLPINRPTFMGLWGKGLSWEEKKAISSYGIGIKHFNPDICCFSDEIPFSEKAKEAAKELGFEIVIIKRTKNISTTEIIERMENENKL